MNITGLASMRRAQGRIRSRVASLAGRALRAAGIPLVLVVTAATFATAFVSPANASTTGSGYIPFPTGFATKVAQGNFGSFSHNNVWNYYAWDFVGSSSSIAGVPVWSATNGTVVYARNTFQGQVTSFGSCYASGNFVIVRNLDGTYTQYLHMQYLSEPVRVGDTVRIGQPLGRVGNTGYTGGAYHLHTQWLSQLTSPSCGIGYSTRASYVGVGVPVTWQIVTSNNPGTGSVSTHHYFKVSGTGGAGLYERTGPGTSFSAIRLLAEGTTIDILCQTRSSSAVGGSYIWDKLNDSYRGFVSDNYVNTPVWNAFTPGIPQC